MSSQRCRVSTRPCSSIIDEDSHFLAVGIRRADFDPLESSTFLLFGGTNAAKWFFAFALTLSRAKSGRDQVATDTLLPLRQFGIMVRATFALALALGRRFQCRPPVLPQGDRQRFLQGAVAGWALHPLESAAPQQTTDAAAPSRSPCAPRNGSWLSHAIPC